MEGGEAVVIANTEGARTTPSVVASVSYTHLQTDRQGTGGPDASGRGVPIHFGGEPQRGERLAF